MLSQAPRFVIEISSNGIKKKTSLYFCRYLHFGFQGAQNYSERLNGTSVLTFNGLPIVSFVPFPILYLLLSLALFISL